MVRCQGSGVGTRKDSSAAEKQTRNHTGATLPRARGSAHRVVPVPASSFPMPVLRHALLIMSCGVCRAFLTQSSHPIFSFQAASTAAHVEVLAPGLVVVRGALSTDEQQRMASEAEKLDGFFAGGDGRERVFDRVRALPRCFRRICAKAVKHACNADDELPGCAPTHCLL